MENTVLDPINNQVSVKYLYKENLKELGENYHGAIKRTKTLHAKMLDKPKIATEIDKYIQEQINNGNYEMINIEEARKKHQLHFVGYNFVVSSTSSSFKVRMITDSSMRTETGLSLNEVMHPTCPWRRPQPPWNLNSLQMPSSLSRLRHQEILQISAHQ